MLCVVHLEGLDSDIFILESSWESYALVDISMVDVDPWTFKIPNKRGTNMETKLLKFSMSRLKFFYLANRSLFETGAFEHVWPP